MKQSRCGVTFMELLIAVAILALLIILIAGGIGNFTKSDGHRSGLLTKLSYKGMVKKSWEGEITLGGLNQGAANTWEFTVTDPEIATNLEACVGKNITVHYSQTVFHNPFSRDTSYIVLSFETIDAKEPSAHEHQ